MGDEFLVVHLTAISPHLLTLHRGFKLLRNGCGKTSLQVSSFL